MKTAPPGLSQPCLLPSGECSTGATHNTTWLAAAAAAFGLVQDNFLNVDGTIALKEASRAVGPDAPANGTDEWPPQSYPLRYGARTGETCCSTCEAIDAFRPAALTAVP